MGACLAKCNNPKWKDGQFELFYCTNCHQKKPFTLQKIKSTKNNYQRKCTGCSKIRET